MLIRINYFIINSYFHDRLLKLRCFIFEWDKTNKFNGEIEDEAKFNNRGPTCLRMMMVHALFCDRMFKV